MDAVAVTVFAKINIGLEVFSRNSTGYHDIESIFQNVSISDSLVLRIHGCGEIAIEGEFGCPPNASSVYRAVMIFDDVCAGLVRKSGISISVQKGIPSGAGLGGAGADAAAVLCGLNELFEKRFNQAELARLGERIASDVPFFLYGGAAIVRGRGERIAPIVPRTDFGLLILQPRWVSRTPEAYMALDLLRNERSQSQTAIAPQKNDNSYSKHLSDNELEREYRLSYSQWPFKNDFQQVLMKQQPLYKELFSWLEEQGASYVSLTGSGSCVFGVFDSIEKAEKIKNEYKNVAPNVSENTYPPIVNIFAAQPLARSMIVSYSQDCNDDTRSDKERTRYGSD